MSTMEPLLEPKRPRDGKPQQLAAVILMCGLGAGFWYAVHYLEHHTRANPMMIVLFPTLGVSFMMALLPLAFFLSFEREFKNINPLLPGHYWYLLKKTYQSLSNNQWKVSAKDI